MHSSDMQEADATVSPASGTTSARPWWVTAIVILGSLLLIVGAMIALLRPQMLLSPDQPVTPAVRVYAGYLVSRNLALALMLLSELRAAGRVTLHGMMVLYALVQLLDAVMDVTEHRWTVLPVIIVLALLFLVGARRLSQDSLRSA
jgi:hypothetical protein